MTNHTNTQLSEAPECINLQDALKAVSEFCDGTQPLVGERFKKQLRNTIRAIPRSRASVAAPQEDNNEGVWFKAAVSGLWYTNYKAAGDVAAVRVDGVRFDAAGPHCDLCGHPFCTECDTWCCKCGDGKVSAASPAPSQKVEEVAAGERDKTHCEHGVVWSMECLTCDKPEYVAAAPVTPDAARKAAADEIAAWIFKLETPLTSETDLQTTSGIVERIISRYLPVVVEDEIVYVYEALDNTMQCRRCKEVFKPDMNNRFSVIHSCKSAASAVLKRETPRYED